MSKLKFEIKEAKNSAIIYTLIKIDPYSNADGCLFVLSEFDEHTVHYASSTCQFGDWLKRLQFKIGDKFRMKVNQANEVEYAEALD